MDWSSIDWAETLKGVLALFGALGIGGAAGAGIRAQYLKLKAVREEVGSDAVKNEWKELALAREQKIEDLERELANHRDRIEDLEQEIARLQGQLEAVLALKEERIADRVAELLQATGQVRG